MRIRVEVGATNSLVVFLLQPISTGRAEEQILHALLRSKRRCLSLFASLIVE